MTMDTLMLARLQFAANISFHILFPTITIALCWLLVFCLDFVKRYFLEDFYIVICAAILARLFR